MPAVPLPEFDRLVQGNDYHRPTGPTSDAADTSSVSGSQHIMDSTNDPMQVQPVSVPSSDQAAAPLGAFLTTNLHETNWLDPTKPHVSPEPQK